MGLDTADYLDSISPEAMVQMASNISELKDAISTIEENQGEILGRNGQPVNVESMMDVLNSVDSLDDKSFVASYFIYTSRIARVDFTANHGIRDKYLELLKKRYVEVTGVEPISN